MPLGAVRFRARAQSSRWAPLGRRRQSRFPGLFAGAETPGPELCGKGQRSWCHPNVIRLAAFALTSCPCPQSARTVFPRAKPWPPKRDGRG